MNLRDRIINDLKAGLRPDYRRYGIPKEELYNKLRDIERDNEIYVDWLKPRSPDGTPGPHYGDPGAIRLRKK